MRLELPVTVHHLCLAPYSAGEQSFVHARQTFYQLHYKPSPLEPAFLSAPALANHSHPWISKDLNSEARSNLCMLLAWVFDVLGRLRGNEGKAGHTSGNCCLAMGQGAHPAMGKTPVLGPCFPKGGAHCRPQHGRMVRGVLQPRSGPLWALLILVAAGVALLHLGLCWSLSHSQVKCLPLCLPLFLRSCKCTRLHSLWGITLQLLRQNKWQLQPEALALLFYMMKEGYRSWEPTRKFLRRNTASPPT